MRISPKQLDPSNLLAELYLGVCSPPLHEEHRKQIDEWLAQGGQPVEIARHLGLPLRRVRDRIYRRRQQRQHPLPQSEPKDCFRLAHELWNRGYTLKQIAAECGYGFKQLCGIVAWYRKRFGWFARRNKKRTPT